VRVCPSSQRVELLPEGGALCGPTLLYRCRTSYLNWHWIFYINAQVGALAVLASLRYVAASGGTGRRGGFDIPGAVTVTAGTMLLVYAITQAPTRPGGGVRPGPWAWAGSRCSPCSY
jgi:hypothetical protein